MPTKAQETAARLSEALAVHARDARQADLEALAYLLDMARLEAETRAKGL